MGGDAIPKVPDWRTCTVGPHTPELQKVERMLSSLNLKVGSGSCQGREARSLAYYGPILPLNILNYNFLPLYNTAQDPWLRNEAWRFDRRPGGAGFDRKPAMKKFLTRGMLPGFGLACITAGIHYYLESQNNHGHH